AEVSSAEAPAPALLTGTVDPATAVAEVTALVPGDGASSGLTPATAELAVAADGAAPVLAESAQPAAAAVAVEGVVLAGAAAESVSGEGAASVTGEGVALVPAGSVAQAGAPDTSVVPLAWVVSGKTVDALAGQAARVLAFVQDRPSLSVADVGLSLATTRAAFERRAVVTGVDRASLLDGLAALAEGRTAPGVVQGVARSTGKVGVLFTG
ncbi:CurL C-terminal domain-containing protein, partial [Microbispora amethystogenes]